MGLTLGLTFTIGDAASRDAGPTVRTIVPAVAIAQPGVTLQGATLAAETPQPGVRSPGSDATTTTVPSATTDGVAALAIQPGVTGANGQTLAAAAPSVTTDGVAALAIQPGVAGSNGKSVAATNSDSFHAWTTLSFAASYDANAAQSLNNAIGAGTN